MKNVIKCTETTLEKVSVDFFPILICLLCHTKVSLGCQLNHAFKVTMHSRLNLSNHPCCKSGHMSSSQSHFLTHFSSKKGTISACGKAIVLMDLLKLLPPVSGRCAWFSCWDRSQVNLHPAVVYCSDDCTSDWSIRCQNKV